MWIVYTINVNPVASNGSCALVGGVLNPTSEDILHPCTESKPSYCPIGNLAGKHGLMPGSNFVARYAILRAFIVKDAEC